MKKDITGLIKEVKRLMVICQIKVLWDIKLKDYSLFWNFDKLSFKLNKGGLNSKREKFEPNPIKTTHCLLGKGISHFWLCEFRAYSVWGEEFIFGLISLYLLWSSPCSCEEKEEEK